MSTHYTLPRRKRDPAKENGFKSRTGNPEVPETMYRKLYESMSDAFASVDMKGRFQEFNESYLSMLGYDREELLDLTYEDITLEKWHAFEVGIIREQVLKNGHSDLYEKEYRRKDGRVVPVELRAFLIRDENGEPFRIWAIVRDISARKRIENREHWRSRILEAITTAVPLVPILDLLVMSIEAEDPALICSVLLLDDEGKHLLHGSAPNLPDFYNQAIHGEAIGDARGSCGTAAYTGKRVIVEDILTHPYWTEFKEIAQKAGLRSAWSEPILSTQGKVLGTFAIYHRIPCTPDEDQIKLISYAASLASIAIERKKAEETIIQAKAAAEIANEAKSRFLAILSHELRTPLNPVMMLVYEWQKNRDFPAKFIPDLLELQRCVETEIALINDLLDVTAIDHAKIKFSPQIHDVEDLLISTIHTVESGHQDKTVRIETAFEAEQTMVNMDPTKLQQVFWNLLRNALKFTPNSGKITVSTKNEDHRIRIDISDTGIGIRPEVMPRIFEAFEQGDFGNSREYSGLGLGLTIAKGMLEAMGGTIKVNSHGQGCGSTFSVLLETFAITYPIDLLDLRL